MKHAGRETANIGWKFAQLAAIVLAATIMAAGPAGAISLTFEPVTLDVTVGGTAAVGVVVSGLGAGDEIVSAFDLFVGFDPTILGVKDVAFTTLLDDPSDPVLGAATTGWDASQPGTLELFANSWILDETVLQKQQPDSFTLATITFDGLSAGTSLLTFLDHPKLGFQDVKGLGLGFGQDGLPIPGVLDFGENVGTGSATVNASVPEPGTLLLLGSGLLGLVGTGLRRRRG